MPALAGQFVGVLVASHYVAPVFFLQLACGILFLINRYVPLALTLVGPVIVNIPSLPPNHESERDCAWSHRNRLLVCRLLQRSFRIRWHFSVSTSLTLPALH